MKISFDFSQDSFHLKADLSLPSNQVSAIFGPSGCGKTTLLRAIAGLDKQHGSEVVFGEHKWQSATNFVPTHQRSIGYVFQEASLFTHLNVQKNLDYAIKRTPVGEQKISIEQVIQLLKIDHLLKRSTHDLSGGERQRVALARTLLASPKLLLMDEPLSALDQEAKHEILTYIERCHSELGIPIIYVSHVLEEVSRIADHLVLMEQGRIIGQGSIEDMLTQLDSPLALGPDAESIVDATVAEFDNEFNVTYLESPLGRFTTTTPSLEQGKVVRLRLAARDISLTLKPQTGTSILNIFPATVDQIQTVGEALVTVRLLINHVPVLARLTKKSATLMKLESGMSVYAQVKSVALV